MWPVYHVSVNQMAAMMGREKRAPRKSYKQSKKKAGRMIDSLNLKM